MEELTIEEKAERYDEVVNEIKKLRDVLLKEGVINENGIICDNFNRIFPELKEEDDDRIRKGLLNSFKEIPEPDEDNSEAYYAGMRVKDIITWLEKQGKQKPVWNEEDERISKTIIIGIKNAMFGDEMREKYQHIQNANKDYYQIRIDWLKSLKDRFNI